MEFVRQQDRKVIQSFEVHENTLIRLLVSFAIDLDSKSETSLRCPLRQTLPIFKQPVTYYPKQRDEVKSQVLNANNPPATTTSTTSGGKPSEKTKPRQLFWEKRFENLKPMDIDGQPFEPFKLPEPVQGVGLNMSPETVVISLATALHLYGNSRALFGQNNQFQKYPTSYVQRDQPLIEVDVNQSLFILVSLILACDYY